MKKLIYSSMAVAMLASFAAAQENSPAWAEKGCVAFVNGTGDYDQNCYNSGLLDMTEGKCYTFNTDRNVVPQWINNVASQTWWWVETECVEPAPTPDKGPFVTESKGCIDFVNGTGDYDQHCYKSGLLDMTEGKCYTFNKDRIVVPQWINNVASQSWWWNEIDCDEIFYCSEHPEKEGCQPVVDCTDPANAADPQCVPPVVDCNDPANADDPQCVPPVVDCTDPANAADPQCVPPVVDCTDPANASDPQCVPPVVDCNDPANADDPQCVPPVVDCTDPANAADPQCVPPVVDCTDPANAADPQCVPPTNPCTEETVNTAECRDFCAENAEDAVCARIVDKCITYKHGVGHYTENCYKSGLTGQVEGKCYAVNPDRVNEYKNSLVINDHALDAYWWYEVSCDKKLGPDMSQFDVVDKGCVEFVNGEGNYAGKCFNAGLYDMTEGMCYVLREERGNPQGHINNRASDAWWWEEVECTELKPKAEPKAKPEPKVAGKTLNVVAASTEVKTLRVFDLNGKLLHTETFSGSVQSVDFAKFAGKGMRLVRITAGNKLVATKTVR
ncbi:MAG: T9SS type A sorting domain-containing protein [Fibrobacter sp.]|nr:T9SS type A sorting domain-containing protein [Fibrobacter sp.]